jgi:two-component system NtrC family response regulator
MSAESLNIIVVDDEEGMCLFLKSVLTSEGHSVKTFTSPKNALQALRDDHYSIAIVDMRMPEPGGMGFLRESMTINPELMVIMMTAYGSIENAVESLKLGARDYITKPFKTDEILLLISKLIERKSLIDENRKLKRELEEFQKSEITLGKNSGIKEIAKLARKIAPSLQSVLITGESGTGKEVLANFIHSCSDRSGCPFVPVQCNLLPLDLFESELIGHKKGAFTGASSDKTGLFEEAHGGTLFLDEIGDISLDIQGKLLRFLQHREVRRVGDNKSRILDVRIILATNKNLETLVRENRFREDLYYRIKVMSLHLPPLRERREDIPFLATAFLDSINAARSDKIGMEREALKFLVEYRWPGNIRELKNCLETAAVMCENSMISVQDVSRLITRKDGTANLAAGGSFRDMKAQVINSFEKNYVTNLLVSSRGNISAAARDAGLDRKNLFDLIKKHGIDVRDFK